jgi:hypothetical protein
MAEVLAVAVVAVVVVAAAGLVVLVVVLVEGVKAVAGSVVAGLDVVAGALRSADGLWASATEAIATRAVSDKVIGLIGSAIVLRRPGGVKPDVAENRVDFYVFSKASKRLRQRAGNLPDKAAWKEPEKQDDRGKQRNGGSL